MWLDNQCDTDLQELLAYITYSFSPLPSNKLCVDASVKDAALCRRSGCSKRIDFLLNFFCSTITSDVISSAKLVSIVITEKVKGEKRKSYSDDTRGHAI